MLNNDILLQVTDLASSSAHSWMIYVWKCVPFLILFSVWVMHVKFSKFFHIVFFYSLCFNLKFVDYTLSMYRKALPFSFLPQSLRKQLLPLETSQRPAGRLDQLSVLLYVPKGIIPRVHRYSRPAVFHGINYMIILTMFCVSMQQHWNVTFCSTFFVSVFLEMNENILWPPPSQSSEQYAIF